MSRAKSPIKVLKTAYNRVEKGWIQGKWFVLIGGKAFVCLEGAIYGYCQYGEHEVTDAMKKAIWVVQQVIYDRYDGRFATIPGFNDFKGGGGHERTTQDEVLEVIKLAIIRLENEKLEEDLTEEVEDLFGDEDLDTEVADDIYECALEQTAS